MKVNKNITNLILLTIFLALTKIPAKAQTKFKIGVSIALSGEASTWGTDMKNAILLAKEEFLKDDFELIIEDDKCDPKTAVSIANKFISINKVDGVLGYTCSGPLLAAAPLYESAKIPVVSSSASSAKISDAGKYIFRTFPSDKQAAKELYQFIAKKHQTLAVISTESEYCQDFTNEIKISNQENKLKIIYQNVISDEIDIKPILLKLKNKGIDAIFLNSNSDREFFRSLKQMKQVKIDLPIYSAYWGCSTWLVSEARTLADNIFTVDVASENKVLNEEGRRVLSLFRQIYGEPNFSGVLVAANWEAVRALSSALKNSKNPKEYLENTKFQGNFGEWKFDKNGDIEGLSFSMKKTTQGKVEEL